MNQLRADFARIFATSPASPPPISPEEFEALRVRADLEFQQHREASRNSRALVEQVQHNAHMGVWS